jgi:hypothetical protein
MGHGGMGAWGAWGAWGHGGMGGMGAWGHMDMGVRAYREPVGRNAWLIPHRSQPRSGNTVLCDLPTTPRGPARYSHATNPCDQDRPCA